MGERSSRPDALLARRGGAVEFLRVPAFLMKAVTVTRNRLYDHGWLPTHRLQMPVVSVGNLSVGGTGKTPMVVLLARALESRGFRPGVLSRGYRAQEQNGGQGGLNDEGKLFELLLPGMAQVQRPDRVSGALELRKQGADAILLDDGFQHRRLARDVDLVLIDATRPWGLPAEKEGEAPVCDVLPRGLLREGLDSLARASAIVITRSDAVSGSELAALESQLQAVVPGVARLLAEHRPVALLEGAKRTSPLELRGRAVRLVSGIGNPEAFERTARSLGATISDVHAFADHHSFELDELRELAQAGELLVTAKDAVKLRELGVPHLVLEVELVLTRGEQVLNALLDSLPRSQRAFETDALHSGLHG
jgi:tetraacyldisaccharide 4'-kinase